MKQAEITFNVKGNKITVVDYKNVLTYREIISLTGLTNASKYIGGFCFYLVPPDGSHNEFIRIGTAQKSYILYKGMTFYDGKGAMERIISDMQIAGGRFSAIVNGETITVKI